MSHQTLIHLQTPLFGIHQLSSLLLIQNSNTFDYKSEGQVVMELMNLVVLLLLSYIKREAVKTSTYYYIL